MVTAVNERPVPTGEGLTFEKVWAMFQESRQEADRQRQETDRQMKENAERQAERQREADRQMKETKRIFDELGRQMGDLHNSFGELAEHLVAPGIHARFNELGYHFGEIMPGGVKIYGEDGQLKAQIDLLLENDETVMAIEVKSRVLGKDVEKHLHRLDVLREHRHKKNDTRKILGAVAGAIFGEAEKKAVAEAGFYIIEQTGDTMKINVPEGFVPREW